MPVLTTLLFLAAIEVVVDVGSGSGCGVGGFAGGGLGKGRIDLAGTSFCSYLPSHSFQTLRTIMVSLIGGAEGTFTHGPAGLS